MHWQLDVCRLLLAKGADIEARQWDMQRTPFGLICGSANHHMRPDLALLDRTSNDPSDVLCFLAENGADICAETEVTFGLVWLGHFVKTSHGRTSRATICKIARAFSWLFRKYRLDTTCDGILANVAFTWESYEALLYSGICSTAAEDFWRQERTNCQLFMPTDTQALQGFWLSVIYHGYPGLAQTFSSHFCRTYHTDFHYQALLELLPTGEILISPLEAALGSFQAFETFHVLLLTSGQNAKTFAEMESTRPWCIYAKQTLVDFFSIELDAYDTLRPLIKRPTWCRRCRKKIFEGLYDWGEVVELVKSGRSLESVLKCPLEKEQSSRQFRNFCEACESDVLGSGVRYDD